MTKRALIGAVALCAAASGAAAHSSSEILSNPWQPRTEFATTTAAGNFVLVVAPNLVDYTRARAAALAESARYCQSIGKAAPAKFGRIDRYSDIVLDGWEFAGKCQ